MKKEGDVKEEDTKMKTEKDEEKNVLLSDAVLSEYEEVQKENKRLHNMVTELHKKHHSFNIKVWGVAKMVYFPAARLCMLIKIKTWFSSIAFHQK